MSKLAQIYIKKLETIPCLHAFDPGGNTGYVYVEYGKLVTKCTLPLARMYDFCASKQKPGPFIIEEYVLYPWAATSQAFDTIPSARVIGALQVAARINGNSIVMQTASSAKDSVDNETIRRVFGAYANKSTKHELDALRHVLLYTSRQLTELDTRR